MRRLSECPVDGPGAARRRCEYHLVDRKDGTDDRRDPLTLCITSEKHEFVVYALDRAEVEWDGKRPDGVLIADLPGCVLVCFIELKASMKGDPARWARATEQLRGAFAHFSPMGQFSGSYTHGDEHHDQWRAEDDPLPVWPKKDHLVFGMVVAFRQAPPRVLPVEETIAGKRVSMLLTSIPMVGMNRAEISLEALCAKLGLR
jgi:hypothetical protein